MTDGSIFWYVIVVVSGAFIVLLGLLMEQLSEQKLAKNINEFRCLKVIKLVGEWFVIIGVLIEFGVGCKTAIDEWKNDPLKQPVSQISAVLRFEVNAKNYDPKRSQNPDYLEKTSLSLGAFRLSAKESRWFEHVDNFATHHVGFYGVSVRFEQNILPYSEWNDINSTNPDVFMPPSVTVKDAISSLSPLDAYIDFIPKDAQVVKCSATVFINGHRKDIQINTNYISKKMSEWNPNMSGIFLICTNSIP
jgi:hypothetical protein